MKIPSYWEAVWTGNRRGRLFLSTMAVLNIGFAAVNIFFWSAVALVLSDPLSWATWYAIGSVGRRPDLLDYPFILLWALPVAGTAFAALNNMMGFKRLAKFSAIFPLALYSLTVGWWFVFKDSLP